MSISKVSSAMIAFAALLLSGWLIVFVSKNGPEANPVDSSSIEPSASVLVVSSAKKKEAGIGTQRIRRLSIPITRTLPARFAYDDTRHVALRAATSGVLESVLVKTGDRVNVGQPLAILRSPAIGLARSDVLSSQAELTLATKEFDWQTKIHDGVTKAAKMIGEGVSVDVIERKVADETLGKYRGLLLSKYSQFRLASQIASSLRDVGQSGAISGRVLQERKSDQQQAKAELQAAMEEALFETKQARGKAEAARSKARRDQLIAQQTLFTLIGASVDTDTGLDISPNDVDLSALTIVSPLDGTVERKIYSATERVSADAELFVIADTSFLWVEADVRERDWTSINVKEGDEVFVTVPALPGVSREAKVYFVGREVDSDSGAIPLVVRIDNADQKYRPGLSARVEVPVSIKPDAIVVPLSAVVDLDGQTSVFVQQDDGFVPVAVDVGEASGGRIEVRSGLSVDQMVVVSGAFALKSELLLEGEE